MEYEEVRVLFQEFLDAITTINALTAEANTPEEVAHIEGEIDRILTIGDEVYCKLVGNDLTVPDNYGDIDRVVRAEAQETGIPKHRIEEVFDAVVADHEEISACSAWVETRRRLERERQLVTIAAGQTSPSDWQLQ